MGGRITITWRLLEKGEPAILTNPRWEFQAFVGGDPDRMTKGRTLVEALGKLVILHAERLGLEIRAPRGKMAEIRAAMEEG